MRVKTEKEMEHFIAYASSSIFPIKLYITGKDEDMYMTVLDTGLADDKFEIHEDLLSLIQTKCMRLKIENRIFQ